MWNPNAKSAAKINKKQSREGGTGGTTPHNTLSLSVYLPFTQFEFMREITGQDK